MIRPDPISAKAALRRAIGRSYTASVLWSAGNALSSGFLLIYLARALGATGFQISLVLAAPSLVGVVRLLTPTLILRFGTAKRICLAASVAAYVILACVPLMLAADGALFAGGDAAQAKLAALIGLLCLHQVIEQIATVALFTWLGDLVPRRLRGRYFGRRNILQILVLLPLLPGSGWVVHRLEPVFAQRPGLPHALVVGAGALLLLVSVVPLVRMPASLGGDEGRTPRRRPTLRDLWTSLRRPLAELAPRRLLSYGCWLSLTNGLFHTAQNIFPGTVLGLPLTTINLMKGTMHVGQIGVSAIAGPAADRRGNRPVLIVCQLIIGTAPLFYLAASREQPYWAWGAWVLWSAFAGINICLPNLTLRLAPPGESAAHLAAYHAYTSVFFAAGTLGGGWLFDRYARHVWLIAGTEFDRYTLAFLLAWLTRTAGAAVVARVPEGPPKRDPAGAR